MYAKALLVRLSVLITGTALSGMATGQPIKWDMPTAFSDGTFQTRVVNEFADDVAKGGGLEIAVHSNASLIKLPEIKRAVQTGQVPIGEILLSALSNENAVFAFDSNPFLARGYDEQKKLWAVAKPYVEKLLDSQGIKLLYSVPWPPQALWTKKEINSLDDLKSLKLRSQSPTVSRLASLLGVSPVTVQLAELPQAFRTGVVDLMITASSGGYDIQAWDYLTFAYDTQAWLPHNAVIVNKAYFERLDPKTRKLLLDAAATAEKRGWEASEQDNKRAFDLVAEHGIAVKKPSPKLASEFEAIGKTMAAEWAKRAGPDGEAILKAYQE